MGWQLEKHNLPALMELELSRKTSLLRSLEPSVTFLVLSDNATNIIIHVGVCLLF